MAHKMIEQMQEPLGRRIRKKILSFIFFPHKVASRYKNYHSMLRIMGDKEFKFDYAIARVNQNNRLINLFIRMPLAVGILLSGFFVYSKLDQLKSEFKQIPKSYKINITKETIKKPRTILVQKRKVDFSAMYFMLIPFCTGSILCLFGAYFLSLNDVFEMERKIRKQLVLNKYLDEDGEPWNFAWTPYGVMFLGYNCDPYVIKHNMRFWNSINFKPDEPKISTQDPTVFMFTAAYELPRKIALHLIPLIEGREPLHKASSESKPEPLIDFGDIEADIDPSTNEENEVILASPDEDLDEEIELLNEEPGENATEQTQAENKSSVDTKPKYLISSSIMNHAFADIKNFLSRVVVKNAKKPHVSTPLRVKVKVNMTPEGRLIMPKPKRKVHRKTSGDKNGFNPAFSLSSLKTVDENISTEDETKD
jgi:hypothetical protein